MLDCSKEGFEFSSVLRAPFFLFLKIHITRYEVQIWDVAIL